MRLDETKKVINDYYLALNIVPNTTRYREQVQARSAMMVALCAFMSKTEVAKAFDMHHASVIHHMKNHEGNLASWTGYAEKFEIAERVCHGKLRMPSIEIKLSRVRNEIKRLKIIEQQLESATTENLINHE